MLVNVNERQTLIKASADDEITKVNGNETECYITKANANNESKR